MKNILITGANGQLGKKIKDESQAFSNFNFYYTDIEELDILNYKELEKFLINNKIDIIINCAAYTAVDLAETEVENTFNINTLAPEHLAKLTKFNNVKFIHISTDYVFDGQKNTPYNEEDQTNPQSVYGKSKLDGERKVLIENPDSVIIRTSWLYSEYGKNFVKTMINLMAEKSELKVVYDQIGTPTYAGDLAYAILIIIEKFTERNIWKSGVFHYSDLGVCSWFDFAKKIMDIYYKTHKTKILPVLSNEFKTAAQRPNYSVLNKSKIMETYGLDIPYWEESLRIMIENYKIKNNGK